MLEMLSAIIDFINLLHNANMKTYRNKYFLLFTLLFPIFILSLIISIVSILKIFYINSIIGIISFVIVLIFISYPRYNSALFNKVIIKDGFIEIHDFMPRFYLSLPVIQKINILDIKDIFWSSYDFKSSIKTSRFRINKNNSTFDYVMSKNPRIKQYLVFRLTNEKNAYMRYFNCYSNESKRDIFKQICNINKNVLFRLSNYEINKYNVNNCA